MSEQWVGKLGGPNQWRGVPYIERSGKSVRCLLCGTGWMSADARRKHFRGLFHKEQYREIRKEENKRKHREHTIELVYASKSLQDRIESLGCAEWQHNIRHMIFNILPSAPSGDFEDLSIPNTLADIKKKLSFYEQKEKTSLLELAIWKASISNFHFSSIEEMREYPALESGFDPNKYTMNRRITSGCTVIIPIVISFLGWS